MSEKMNELKKAIIDEFFYRNRVMLVVGGGSDGFKLKLKCQYLQVSLEDIKREVLSRGIFSGGQFIFYALVIARKYDCHFDPFACELYMDARGNSRDNLERIKNAQKDIYQICAGFIAKSIVADLMSLHLAGLMDEALSASYEEIQERDIVMGPTRNDKSVEP